MTFVYVLFLVLLTFLTVQARVTRRAHTLSIHTDAAVLALKVVLAHVFHHLTTLTCGGHISGSGVRGQVHNE